MRGGGLLELGVAHVGRTVGLVGDGAHNDEGDAVVVADMGDGSTFHLAAHPTKRRGDALLGLSTGNELVARADAAFVGVHALERLGGPKRSLAQAGVGIEGDKLEVRVLAGGVAKRRHVEVMLGGVSGDHDVAHLEHLTQGAGNAGVDDMRDAKAASQRLRAHGRMHLADATLDDDDGHAIDGALAELHPRQLGHFGPLKASL